MATKETRVEEHEGVEYELEPTKYKSRCVGLAPTRSFKTDEEMLEHYGLPALCALAGRQLKQDAKNAVRGKFNKDKVSASAVVKAIGSGVLTSEDVEMAALDVREGRYKTFTDACAARMGIGEDALENANPEHIHWDCAK